MQRIPGRRFPLLQRRTVWWPTWVGWCALTAGLAIPALWWFLVGESFLSPTQRLPAASVLVVEGWIGREGVHAAASEFEAHGYSYVATSGGPTSGSWEGENTSYAEVAGVELLKLGIPNDRLIIAPCATTKTGRTFASAAAVLRVLETKQLRPKELNVFTYGPHARRSQLVFSKVFRLETAVGVIAWTPSDYHFEPWWRSSRRAKELLSESAGFLFEFLLNSGRLTNAPPTN